MSDVRAPWEEPEIANVLQLFGGHVAEIKQIDVVVIGGVGEDDGAPDRQIHG